MKKKTIRDYVQEWNVKFPLDRWYRKKYNIRFGSMEHRNVSMFHILFEFEEDKFYNEIYKDLDKKDDIEEVYTIGDFLKSRDSYEGISNEDLSKLILKKNNNGGS